ncbi:MAG: hypothetical protein HY692_07820 [Cyanobacteria bacterium NC_groundwater_1444_Ag_S-0.65um_54_12]|nr:hypothetical protein [Cyanobacteria bacterium NC_groundwater_1444_Ag_S-0.65um_54_12]
MSIVPARRVGNIKRMPIRPLRAATKSNQIYLQLFLLENSRKRLCCEMEALASRQQFLHNALRAIAQRQQELQERAASISGNILNPSDPAGETIASPGQLRKTFKLRYGAALPARG